MKTIGLSQGKVALVDDADYEWLNQWRWSASKAGYTFYAIRKTRTANGAKTSEQMHRLILGLMPGDDRQCDHRDGNGLNNQRSNLRTCTITENNVNSRKRKAGTSSYKGVYRNRNYPKWQSRIRVNGKLIYLGSFESEIEAARIYDLAALQHYGDFALTNKMMGPLN